MTEVEWLTCGDPERMLEFLRDEESSRKLRLFGCATCRRIWHLFTMEESRACVETAERYADGQANPSQLSAAAQRAMNFPWRVVSEEYLTAEAAAETAFSPDSDSVAHHVSVVAVNTSLAANENEERVAQSSLLRDIFGNPFRPVALDPAWLTSTVIALAEGIYQDRAFERLPILADALQDTGCDSDDILTHCRDTALTHVRGCWVIDLLTGRK